MLHVSGTSTVDIFITVIDLKKLLDCVAREEVKMYQLDHEFHKGKFIQG